ALRATSATNALSHGSDIAEVQEWLGHSSIATTRLYDRRKLRPEDSPTFKSNIEEGALSGNLESVGAVGLACHSSEILLKGNHFDQTLKLGQDLATLQSSMQCRQKPSSFWRKAISLAKPEE